MREVECAAPSTTRRRLSALQRIKSGGTKSGVTLFEVPGKSARLSTLFAGQSPVLESILYRVMRTTSIKRAWSCVLAVLVWMTWFQPELKAQQRVIKFSPKVMEVLEHASGGIKS